MIINLKNFTVKNNDITILDQISFSVKKGEFIYIIGKTGSGKSSFLKSLYGDMKILKGKGIVSEFDIIKIKYDKIPYLRRKIGFVFQDFKLLNDRSVFDNLDFVLRATGWKESDKINDQIDKVLELVGFESPTSKFPNELSGGEQQRVAIARSMLNDPKLIIADEPTGNLDPETSSEIINLFKKLNSIGTSMIIATHDYDLIIKLDGQVYKCEDGSIFEVQRK